ncbi:aspartate kinase [Candidatus Woesearchaeota archaeon]|nr:aspartate kinase [Candidatus Woesearchaeota archaeon]
MIVMKFGGSSVGSADRIQNVCSIIRENLDKHPVVVVSAVGGITDKLIHAAREAQKGAFEEIKKKHDEILMQLGLGTDLLAEEYSGLQKSLASLSGNGLNAKMLDAVVSFGERMSAKIIASNLSKNNIAAKPFNAWELGLVTDSNYGCAAPLQESYQVIGQRLSDSSFIPVITGYIAKEKNGNITTLGRGGSDYSAAIFGAAINCSEIQIWTDVDGILTTDPRVVKSARTNRYVSFLEAAELAYFGAKVLHPSTILPAVEKDIPVRVLNTFNPQAHGTLILRDTGQKKSLKGIAFKKNITIINVTSTRMLNSYGFIAKIFEVFSKHRKSIDLVATTEVSVSMSVDNVDGLDGIVNELREFGEVSLKGDRVSISIIGDGLGQDNCSVGRIFSCVSGANIEMITQGSSEINVTFVIEKEGFDKAINALHREFFE